MTQQHTPTHPLQEGCEVKCLTASIDRQKHAGDIGVITGFARFSSYHAREAMVKFADGSSEWFWCSSLAKVQS